MGRILLALLLVATVVCLASGCGPENATARESQANWGEAVAGLSCSMHTDKPSYLVGETIHVDLLLRNEVDVLPPVMHPQIHLSFHGDALPLDVAGPNGRCEYTGPVIDPPPPPMASAYVRLRRGEVVGASSVPNQRLWLDPTQWSMTAPGEYELCFRFERTEADNQYSAPEQNKMMPIHAWQGEIVSRKVRIRVVANN